jgi:hypothetical protein
MTDIVREFARFENRNEVYIGDELVVFDRLLLDRRTNLLQPLEARMHGLRAVGMVVLIGPQVSYKKMHVPPPDAHFHQQILFAERWPELRKHCWRAKMPCGNTSADLLAPTPAHLQRENCHLYCPAQARSVTAWVLSYVLLVTPRKVLTNTWLRYSPLWRESWEGDLTQQTFPRIFF